MDAGAGAVMCSYNRINDVYGCANSHTLQDVLKGELGLKGFVTSDWGATHHMTDLMHGLDMEQPGCAAGTSNFSTAGLTAALQNGTAAVPATNDFPAEPAFTAAQWKAQLDDAVFRILTEMNNIGLLEGTAFGTHHTDGTPYIPPRPDLGSLKDSSFAAAQSIAEKSATLLKNDGSALPLSSGANTAQPNTVVVLNTGDPVLMPWAGAVKSILEMWYPGQMGGPATADVLLGNANPGGKLPETFPADATHFPTLDPSCTDTSATGNCPLYPGVIRAPHSYRETTNLDAASGNGIFQGYRWYDQHGVTPLFAFGHGLSYTTFAFSGLTVAPHDDGTVDVGFDVKNTGSVAGDEVPQVYVSSGPALPGVQQAVKALRGFTRVSLAPGETRHVSMTLARRSFEYWNSGAQAWTVNPGPRTIWVGDASDHLALGSTTPAPITVGGTVPATLSLSLGAPASFGAFTPGVDHTYSASTTANVISTAGDARLDVSDPGHLTNGAFSLPDPLQVLGVPRTWSAPVSNDAFSIGFSQHIGATDALRTGSYGTPLTFTLSTTSP